MKDYPQSPPRLVGEYSRQRNSYKILERWFQQEISVKHSGNSEKGIGLIKCINSVLSLQYRTQYYPFKTALNDSLELGIWILLLAFYMTNMSQVMS